MAPRQPINFKKLRQAFLSVFDENDLKSISFDLGIDYEMLPSGNKESKSIGLIEQCRKEGRFDELLTICQQRRPQLDWQGLVQTAVSSLDTSPFMGLKYFDTKDADLFFGREKLTDTLADELKNSRFLAVVGASGSGKSSLVRAGLVPKLQQADPNLRIHLITPTDHPLEAIATELTRKSKSIGVTAKFVDSLANERRTLHLAAKRLVKGEQKLLLVIDQFEELFTVCRSEAQRKAFLDNLITAVSAKHSGPNTIVISLRADFYHHCAQYPELRALLENHQRFIGAMTAEELRRAIEEPAHRHQLQFEEGLVDLLLRDLGAMSGEAPEPGALPLLSHALLETWRRRDGNKLTLSGYTEAGGVHGAIAKTAETVFQEQLSQPERVIARSIFLRLTELGEGTQDTRRRALISELLPADSASAETHKVLQLLSDARLITTDEETAEVAHEALIREWPTLRNWLNRDRTGLRLHRHLTEAVQSWEELDRDQGELYRGARLDQALQWADTHDDELNDLEREFLSESQAVDAAQSRREKLTRQVGLGALLFIVASLIIALIVFNNQATENRDLAVSLEDQVTISAQNELDARNSEATAQAANLQSAQDASIAQTREAEASLAQSTAQAANEQSLRDAEDARNSAATAVSAVATSEAINIQNQGLLEEIAELSENNEEVQSVFANATATAQNLALDDDGDGRINSVDEDVKRPFISADHVKAFDLEEVTTLSIDEVANFIPQQIAISHFNQSTRYVVVGGQTNNGEFDPATLILWDLETGIQLSSPLPIANGPVYSIGIKQDNSAIYSVVGEAGIIAWTVDTSNLSVDSFEIDAFGFQNLCSASISPNGDQVLLGSSNWQFYQIDEDSLVDISQPDFSDPISGCNTRSQFSPDGDHFGRIESESSLLIGLTIQGSFARPFNKNAGGLVDFALAPGLGDITLGFENGEIHHYQYELGERPTALAVANFEGVSELIYSPDGSVLAMRGDSGVRLESAALDDVLWDFDDEAVTSMIFSQDGHYLLFSTVDGKIHVYGITEATQ
ncbi:MAG: hypothetical protein AAF490_26385 [Chloroflexota bacterium]